jgi:hypothetical protein
MVDACCEIVVVGCILKGDGGVTWACDGKEVARRPRSKRAIVGIETDLAKLHYAEKAGRCDIS